MTGHAKAEDAELSAFKVVGRSNPALALVVPQSINRDRLIGILRQFQRARRDGTFDRLIPPTTAGGKLGNYAVVMVFILSDKKLASTQQLQRFLNDDPHTKSFRKFANSIKAYYYYTWFQNYEEGTIDYREDNVDEFKTKDYEKVF